MEKYGYTGKCYTVLISKIIFSDICIIFFLVNTLVKTSIEDKLVLTNNNNLSAHRSYCSTKIHVLHKRDRERGGEREEVGRREREKERENLKYNIREVIF